MFIEPPNLNLGNKEDQGGRETPADAQIVQQVFSLDIPA
jgi:hypothetical protein